MLVVAWNIARTRTAARKRKAGGAEADLRAVLGLNKGRTPGAAHGALAAFGAGLNYDATLDEAMSPAQLAALLGADDLEPSNVKDRRQQGPLGETADPLLSARLGAVPLDLPLPPHELAALLGAAGHDSGSWASGDNRDWGSGESEDD